MSSDISQLLYISSIGDHLHKTFGLFTIIIGTIGNICNCVVFLHIPALSRHPNALFITGCSIGSLIFINIGLWPSIIQSFTGINLSNRLLFWCKIGSWLSYAGGCFSFMCYSYAAFCQFLITLPQVKWQRLITRSRAKVMLSFTALFWICIFLPLPIYNTHVNPSSTTTLCTSSFPAISPYNSYWLIIGYYFSPVLFTSILFGLTWYNLKRFLRRRFNLEGAVTRMMLIQMSFILLSGIPTGICVSYILATQNTGKARLRLAYEYLVLLTLSLFTCLTNGVSFWVYFFVSKPFRKHLKEFVMKSKIFKHRIQPMTIRTIDNK